MENREGGESMKGKHAKEKKREKKLKPLKTKKIVLFLLIYISLFITYFSITTLSKYAGISTGSGTITVAKWDVELDTTNSSNTLNIVAGNTTQSYTLQVTSTSEMGCNYTIELSNVPNGINVSLDSGNAVTVVNNKVTFSNAGSFNANDVNNTRQHTLTFSAPIGANSITNNQVNLHVTFTQKQI